MRKLLLILGLALAASIATAAGISEDGAVLVPVEDVRVGQEAIVNLAVTEAELASERVAHAVTLAQVGLLEAEVMALRVERDFEADRADDAVAALEAAIDAAGHVAGVMAAELMACRMDGEDEAMGAIQRKLGRLMANAPEWLSGEPGK